MNCSFLIQCYQNFEYVDNMIDVNANSKHKIGENNRIAHTPNSHDQEYMIDGNVNSKYKIG